MLLKYTDRHPDVIALKQTIKRLKEQQAEQLREQAANGGASSGDDSNPVTQAAQIALNETDVDIAAAKADVADRQAKVKQLRSMIDEVPEVEAQLAQLNRDYKVVHQQYLDLVQSRETQQLTEKASAADKTHFRVIDPPVKPLTPVAPHRLLLLAFVFLAALSVGAGLSWLLGQLWPVYGSARVLQERIELPVLGTVAHAWEDRYRSQRRWAIVAFTGSLAVMFVAFVGVLAVELVGPGIHGLMGWLA
jgi:polysaccharide chain length determinant protein (PEP-CTERM system associated)